MEPHTSTTQFLWACGLFEGEGHVSASKGSFVLCISSTDPDVLDTFWRITGQQGAISTTQPKYIKTNGQPAKLVYALHLSGQQAMRLAWAMRPYLGQRRRQQIDSAFAKRRENFLRTKTLGVRNRGAQRGSADECYWEPVFDGPVLEALADPHNRQGLRPLVREHQQFTGEAPPSPEFAAKLLRDVPSRLCVECGGTMPGLPKNRKFCTIACSRKNNVDAMRARGYFKGIRKRAEAAQNEANERFNTVTALAVTDAAEGGPPDAPLP